MWKSWLVERSKVLTRVQAQELLRVARAGRDQALRHDHDLRVREWFLIELGLHSGLRVMEMARLKCRDLFLQDGHRTILVRNGKGGKRREVLVTNGFRRTVERFLRWKERRNEPVAPDAPVLSKPDGSAYSTRALQKAFKRVAETASLPSVFAIHSLRHTYAVELLRSLGVQYIRFVQRQLGHSSLATTEAYLNLVDDLLEQRLERLFK